MKYVLDYEKWRCGDRYIDEGYGLGSGKTALYNARHIKHNMCCLGQFAYQQIGANPSLTGIGLVEPENLAEKLDEAYDLNFVFRELDGNGNGYQYHNTELTRQLMNINDSKKTTIKEKVEQIKNLMNNAGLEIEFVNFPNYIMECAL